MPQQPPALPTTERRGIKIKRKKNNLAEFKVFAGNNRDVIFFYQDIGIVNPGI